MLSKIHIPVFTHIECCCRRWIKPKTQSPEKFSTSALSRDFPSLGPQALHMCRYRYYSAHKTLQSHLKVVSCWKHTSSFKAWTRVLQTKRTGAFSPLHKTFLTNRIRLQTFCYTDLFPSSDTLNGSPLNEVISFCHTWRRFWFEGKMIEWFYYCIWEKNQTNFKVAFFSHNLVLGVYTQTPFVFFLYVTGREGEDETLLKEASVLISSEGSPLFFHPHPPYFFLP